MKRRFAKVLAVATGLALATTGCSGDDKPATGADGKTILTVALWNYDTTPEFKALVEAYEAAHPDVDVQPVDILADDYPQKVTTMLAGGDSTDVITMKNVIDYARFGTRGQLASLKDEVDKLDKSKYRGLDAFDLEGDYFALPYRQDFWVLYYNKKLLANSGADLTSLTWQEYADLAKKTTKGSGANAVYGTYQHTWRSLVQAVAAAQTGGDQLSGDYGFMKPQYTMALDLEKAGATLKWSTAKTQKVTYHTMFSEEKAAMLPMGTWYAARLIDEKKAGKISVDWGMAPLPQATEGGSTTFGSPTAFAVNKKARNAEAAKKFVSWASGEKGAAAIAKIGVFPAYADQSILDLYFGVDGMANDDVAKKAFQPGEVKLEMPVSEKSSDVDTVLNEEHELIMAGEKSVDAGIAEMGKRVKSEVG
ncbi:sugar ABC transporter substrate-binding protein [Micromonospora sp. KC606]|uniref:ABC transporter substrate-binding protein n=1 Tax=Micromonospora sp. KC606 TaxID=2530379 RepID=UPI001053EA11|nr:sugar ABC transporter substrate-binding protein [Micromonospora sp. KC606]TDC84954.1 sugar ABC transporter substrate-binding protein [Micromonospora sp. KC606]